MRTGTSLAGLLALLLLSGCARARCARPCPPCPPCPPCAPAPTADAATTASPPQVLVEAAFLRIPAAAAEAALGAELGRTSHSMGILDPAAAAALEERVRKTEGVRVMQQPTIVAISGEEASIWAGESYNDTPHWPAHGDRHELARADPDWAGTTLEMKATVLPDGFLAMDVSFIVRDLPPQGTKPDRAALLANQLHGRMGIARMASGASGVIVVAPGEPARLGDRTLLLITPRVLLPSKR